jgi:hypothetical protein
VKLHLGYGVATVGYVVAILVMATAPPESGGWRALVAAVLQVPLFAGLAACTLLCLTGGRWQRNVSWRVYVLVMALCGGCAALGEWYAATAGRTGSVGDFIVGTSGIVGLLVTHRLAHRQRVA